MLFRSDLHELEGFEKGFKNPISMADGYGFIGAKAYKDSKLCLMMMANYLHYKYNKLTGVSFCSIYPGCIAESPLFREKRAWFRTYFPIFMKFITGMYKQVDEKRVLVLLIKVETSKSESISHPVTSFSIPFLLYIVSSIVGGFVGEHEAGQRLFQVAHDPRCSKSGVYWSWNGGPREGRGAEALEKVRADAVEQQKKPSTELDNSRNELRDKEIKSDQSITELEKPVEPLEIQKNRGKKEAELLITENGSAKERKIIILQLPVHKILENNSKLFEKIQAILKEQSSGNEGKAKVAIGALIFDEKEKNLVQFGRKFWVEDGETTINRFKAIGIEGKINIISG